MRQQTIVKVQRAIITTTDPVLLVYNAARDKLTEQPPEAKVIIKMGNEFKMFFYAIWDPTMSQWEIGEPAPWQDW